MPRGPHDDEIEVNDSEEDKARRRLEEFLRQRVPNPDPEKEPDEDPTDVPQDPGKSRKP
jgi:hypothetical protein